MVDGEPAPASRDESQQRISELEDDRGEFIPIGRAPGWLRPLLAYQRAVDAVNERVGRGTQYLVILVVLVGFFNAVLRYVGRATGQQLTTNRYFELQWYLYAIIFLLAFGYILKNGINVRVDFWFAERSDRTKAWIDFVGHLIALVPFCVLAIWVVYVPVLTSFGARPDGTFPTWQVWEIWERSPDPQGLPRAPIKLFLLIGFVLLFLQALAELVKLLAEITGHGRFTKRGPARPIRVE